MHLSWGVSVGGDNGWHVPSVVGEDDDLDVAGFGGAESSGGSWSIEPVDAVGIGQNETFIALDGDGLVHAVYYATDANDLRHAFRCP